MNFKRPSHGVIVAYLALFVAMTGTATAATGGTLVLGRSNSAGSMTTLTNTSSGTPLRLNARPGYAPMQVNSGTKVTNLNSDKLDGVDSSGFQKKVSGSCTYGIASLNPAGYGTCATGSAATLGGLSVSSFQRLIYGSCAYGIESVSPLGATSCSGGDAQTLGGQRASSFQLPTYASCRYGIQSISQSGYAVCSDGDASTLAGRTASNYQQSLSGALVLGRYQSCPSGLATLNIGTVVIGGIYYALCQIS